VRQVLPVVVLLLAACAQSPTRQVDAVEIPTGTPCLTLADVPEKPQLLTTDAFKTLRGDSFVTALWHDRLKRIDYEEKLEARIIKCVGKLPIPAPLAPTQQPEPAKPRWQFWK